MSGPTVGDLIVAFVPVILFAGLYVIGLLIGQRQARALERIASALEKKP